MEGLNPAFEAIAIAGTVLSALSKWLLGNKNSMGWAMAIASAACWISFSFAIGSKVMILNNLVCLALVARGCWKWKT